MRWILLLLVCILTAHQASAADISFLVRKLRSNNGLVQVGLYDSAATFPKENAYIIRCFNKEKIVDRQVKVLCSAKPGRYAAAVFHDENMNQTLDTNLLGIPQERYGFSNNPEFRFGPPPFAKVSFQIKKNDLQFNIEMIE